jgi:hypothetical protein
MKKLIDTIIKEGFARDNLEAELKYLKKSVEDSRNELIDCLKEGEELKNSVYYDMLVKEKVVLKEIQSITEHELLVRANKSQSKSKRIKHILEPLVEGRVEVLKDYKVLQEIKNELLRVLEEQLSFEAEELKKIKASIGEYMYAEHKMYFESNEFLKLIPSS